MELFFLPFILIPVIVVCVFVFVIGKGIAQWSHNNSQPVLTSNAKKGGLIEEHHLLPDANEFKEIGRAHV